MTNFESIIILVLAAGSNVLVGLLIFLANPDRAINRSFGFLSIITTLWVGSLTVYNYSSATEAVFWIRNMIGFGGLVPWAFFCLKESIITPNIDLGGLLKKTSLYLIIGLVHLGIVETDSFLKPGSTRDHLDYGWAYFIHVFYMPLSLIYLGVSSIRYLKVAEGIVKLDLKIFLLGCLFAVGAVVITTGSAFLGLTEMLKLAPVLIVVYYSLSGFTMTNRRIFEPRYLTATFLKHLVILVVGILEFLLLKRLIGEVFPDEYAEVIALVGVLISIYPGNNVLEQFLQRFVEKEKSSNELALQRIYDLGKEHPDEELNKARFQEILMEWAGTDTAAFFMPHEEFLEYEDIKLTIRSNEVNHLIEHDWESYESLERVRETGSIKGLKTFMEDHQFRIMLVVLEDKEQNVAFMVGLGRRASKNPYTFSDGTTLKLLCESFRPLLEHSQIVRQVRNSEQLASVGLLAASLAHEIRNPLVAIKTFFQLLPIRYNERSFREEFSAIIQEEVQRIEELSQSLLDSSKPSVGKMTPVSLKEVGSAALDLVTSKGRQKGIEMIKDFSVEADSVMADPGSLRQVLLNILLNAIDAIDVDQTQKKIRLGVYGAQDKIWIEVEDNGKGMSEEIRKNVFKPFYTTKTHGFGLGLTVSGEILKEHDATTRIESEPGEGTKFSIGFSPCPEFS
ncbi:MAG: ATP-binding protein [Verrucomicrobia bacterium]|nr:ATP-binding protein [Verrucomicrobiota bacterium]